MLFHFISLVLQKIQMKESSFLVENKKFMYLFHNQIIVRKMDSQRISIQNKHSYQYNCSVGSLPNIAFQLTGTTI